MRAVLVPVKSFAAAKMRLGPHYSQAERAALAAAMCEDVFATVAKAGVERVYVASSEQKALADATALGWRTIPETEQISESRSVDAASRLCEADGVTALLRLPIDIPLVEPDDIEAIFAALLPAPSAVVVSSRDGTGTNALLRAPPALFASHFGPGSFLKHLAAADARGAAVDVLRNERIGLDIDDLDDLAAAAGRLRPDSATAHWLARHPVSGRDRGPPGG